MQFGIPSGQIDRVAIVRRLLIAEWRKELELRTRFSPEFKLSCIEEGKGRIAGHGDPSAERRQQGLRRANRLEASGSRDVQQPVERNSFRQMVRQQVEEILQIRMFHGLDQAKMALRQDKIGRARNRTQNR